MFLSNKSFFLRHEVLLHWDVPITNVLSLPFPSNLWTIQSMANKVGFNALPHETVHWTLLLNETAFMCFLRGKQSSRRNDVGRFCRNVGTRHAESETKELKGSSFPLNWEAFWSFAIVCIWIHNTTSRAQDRSLSHAFFCHCHCTTII